MLTSEQIKNIKPQDRFNLIYRGRIYPYKAMNTPNGIVLVHEGPELAKKSLGAVPIAKALRYDFIKTEE